MWSVNACEGSSWCLFDACLPLQIVHESAKLVLTQSQNRCR
jgi:hypothetical protein